MAATSQHRCVFVGNIPYDATEEQLVQICEEVGPVVSFRIVTDRETGKPKGYGFCEYKDEETALSARRNLNGYEINGRQLRVDCAANDKNADKNRDQGRGGPGMVSNIDSQKQTGGPEVSLTSGPHQPIGLPVAMTAASVMAGALGGVQAGSKSTQNGLHGQPGLGSDPLTLYLANMSRNQLTEILSELKVLATENKDQARQLLLTNPLLNKAFFQAQLMLGVVTSQMLQMPNIRQASGPPVPPSFQDAVHAQNSMLSQLPTQPRAQNNFQQLGPSPALPGVPTILPIRPQQMINTSVRPQIQPPLSQHLGQAGPRTLGHNSHLVPPYGNLPPSVPVRPPLSDLGFQPTSKLFGIPNNSNAESERPPQVTNDSVRVREVHTYQSLPFGSLEMAAMVQANSDPSSRPSKLVKMNDGRATSFSAADANVSAFRSSQVSGTFGNQIPKAQEGPSSINQSSQVPADVESALLQQVLNLTPEQLSSLPPDQQHQVIQLQQMLRSA